MRIAILEKVGHKCLCRLCFHRLEQHRIRSFYEERHWLHPPRGRYFHSSDFLPCYAASPCQLRVTQLLPHQVTQDTGELPFGSFDLRAVKVTPTGLTVANIPIRSGYLAKFYVVTELFLSSMTALPSVIPPLAYPQEKTGSPALVLPKSLE